MAINAGFVVVRILVDVITEKGGCMEEKKKVYVETSVVSYLVARPSSDLLKMARQVATQEWHENAAPKLSLFRI